jgi:hypothetical protein
MDKIMFVLDAPVLSDEAAATIQNALHTIMDVFDAHYGGQTVRFYQRQREEADFIIQDKNF